MRLVLTARIRREGADAVRAVLEDGPVFDLEETGLERYEVFRSTEELVFVLEGPNAQDEAERLLDRLEARAGRIASHLDARPRVLEEVFSWERRRAPDGVTFAPSPGPGDSDGGPWE